MSLSFFCFGAFCAIGLLRLECLLELVGVKAAESAGGDWAAVKLCLGGVNGHLLELSTSEVPAVWPLPPVLLDELDSELEEALLEEAGGLP